jgi:MIP family channel proteins
MTGEDYRAGFAEFIATMLLVFFGPGSFIAAGITQPGAALTADKLWVIAAGNGLAISVLIWTTGHISGGHLNPAVTFAAWITGKIDLQRGVLYVVAQLLGAVAGSSLLAYVMPDAIQGNVGATVLGAGVDASTGLVVETILTFALVGVIFMTALHPRGPGNVAPLAIGLVVLVDILVGVQLTGASMNPARTFGPAVVAGIWADHWIYWVGPLLGALIAAVLANQVFLKAETL